MTIPLSSLLSSFRIDDDQLRASGNNFTVARLVLASAVIWTHCYWTITGLSGQDEIASVLGVPLSHLAVNGFFFVSGFLICQSLFRQTGPASFATMRFARIWPGLAVCVGLTIAAFALLSGRAGAYLLEPETFRFLARNLTQLVASFDLPAPDAVDQSIIVNGSLWTIPWELRCYLALGIFYLIPQSWRRQAVLGAVLLSIPGTMIWTVLRDATNVMPDLGSGLLYNINIAARLWGCFAAGAAVWLLKDHVRLHPAMVPVLWIAALGEYALFATSFLATPAIVITVLICVFIGGAGRAFSANWPDFSYGIYIYAFPVMVLVQLIWPQDSHIALAAINFALTVPLAAASWYIVEKPALSGFRNLLKRRGNRRTATAAPDSARVDPAAW